MNWDYTHNDTHIVLYRLSTLYSIKERRKYNSLGIYLIKKHTSRVKDISTYNTYQDLQLEGKFLSSFPYSWDIARVESTN